MPRNRSEKSKSVRPKRRDAVDVLRTIYWYQSLCARTGQWTPYRLESVFEDSAFTRRSIKDGGPYHKNKWPGYRGGVHVPSPPLVSSVNRHPLGRGTAREINHVLWETLRPNLDITRYANPWLGQLEPLVQNLVFVTELYPSAGNYYERRRIDGRKLRALERLGSLDALACLTILLREAHAQNEQKLAFDIGAALYRALLMVSLNLPMAAVADRLFGLYRERIFPFAVWNGLRYDFTSFEFSYAGTLLHYQLCSVIEAQGGIADTWRDWIGTLHDLLIGRYGDHVKHALAPPLGLNDPITETSAEEHRLREAHRHAAMEAVLAGEPSELSSKKNMNQLQGTSAGQ